MTLTTTLFRPFDLVICICKMFPKLSSSLGTKRNLSKPNLVCLGRGECEHVVVEQEFSDKQINVAESIVVAQQPNSNFIRVWTTLFPILSNTSIEQAGLAERYNFFHHTRDTLVSFVDGRSSKAKGYFHPLPGYFKVTSKIWNLEVKRNLSLHKLFGSFCVCWRHTFKFNTRFNCVVR